MTLCIGCITAADAQSSFTQRLQQSKNGEGKITVTQDKAIEELVNGPAVTAPTRQKTTATQQKPAEKKKEKENNTATNTNQEKHQEPKTVVVEHQDTTTIDSPEEIQKKIMKGVKVPGYRVQVFAGGNTRNDRLKAERIGSEIKSLFPGVPVYVHFYSPRWICRIGNYRTYEEAHAVLERVKNNGYQSAIIVKGKVTVQYQ
ncbi:Sporulation related domain-containing protein [Xylanibacter ruminicola]|uniref:Sporulation related domain-containing protein n=2 Tax=Xylanibacter ruminicola TaxID=839 RepID=A0A1M6WVG5_XYLRU|nr:Sporulation related domain-containing protein [Xylanibacter ruminicola]